MDLSVTEYENFTDMTLDCTLQMRFKKLPLSEKAYATTCLCKVRFSTYTSAKTMYPNRLNSEAIENPAFFH